MTRILIGPRRTWLETSIEAGGGTVVTEGPADAVVWTDPKRPDGLRSLLDEYPDIAWVQLPWAGIEPFVPILDRDRVWTCGKGVYAEPVAEQANGSSSRSSDSAMPPPPTIVTVAPRRFRPRGPSHVDARA